MKIDHTPAEIRPNRTVYRFTEEEAIVALRMYLSEMGKLVPQGKGVNSAVWHPHYNDPSPEWELSLSVDHPDPPPKDQ